jgi:DNA invertase Pin-like site-specific DNA recombinase
VRAVAYARVSSAMQRDRETIASQLRVLPEFIARQGWILARPIETYVDDGRSAKAGNLAARLGLGALLRDAALGLFDVVVVVDVDRLTRSEDIEERGMILGAFQRARVKLASATSSQVLDLSTSTGDLFTTLHAFFAAEWTRKHRERVVQGKITAIQRGRKPAGRPPYGLAYDRATGQWAIDPVRGPFVVEMFQRVADGDSCRKIADDLHERGAPRPRGPWERHRVARIIRSRALLGTWVVDKTRNLTIAVPPVIDEDLWQRAQVALDASGRRGLRKTEHAYLLEGLCVCAACGSPMLIRSRVWDPRRNGRHQEAAYLCKGRKVFRLGAKRCMQPIVPTADADTRAWRAVVEELSDPGLAAAVAREVEGQGEDARSWEVDAEGYRQHLARLERVTLHPSSNLIAARIVSASSSTRARARSQRRIATGHVDMPRVSAGRGSGCVEIVRYRRSTHTGAGRNWATPAASGNGGGPVRELRRFRQQIPERRPQQPHRAVARRADRVCAPRDAFAPIAAWTDAAAVARDRVERPHAASYETTSVTWSPTCGSPSPTIRMSPAWGSKGRRAPASTARSKPLVPVRRPRIRMLLIELLVTAPQVEAVRRGEVRGQPLRIEPCRAPAARGEQAAPLRRAVALVGRREAPAGALDDVLDDTSRRRALAGCGRSSAGRTRRGSTAAWPR